MGKEKWGFPLQCLCQYGGLEEEKGRAVDGPCTLSAYTLGQELHLFANEKQENFVDTTVKEVGGNSGVEAVSRRFPLNPPPFVRVSHIAKKTASGIVGARSGVRGGGHGVSLHSLFFSRKWLFLRNLLRLMQIHERHREKMLGA